MLIVHLSLFKNNKPGCLNIFNVHLFFDVLLCIARSTIFLFSFYFLQQRSSLCHDSHYILVLQVFTESCIRDVPIRFFVPLFRSESLNIDYLPTLSPNPILVYS